MDLEYQEFNFSDAGFCDMLDKLIEIIWNFSHLKALSFEEFDRVKHIKLTIKNPNIYKKGQNRLICFRT